MAAMTLRTPLDRRVKVVIQGAGTPVVFLHSGVESAGEWKQVFSRWPEGYQLCAIDAYRDGSGPGEPGNRTIDDYADQVCAVTAYVSAAIHLVGFSWGGVTALRVAGANPENVASLTVIEPEAYGLLRSENADAYDQICELRDRWRTYVHADRWYEASELFIDFYNGPGSFAAWPQPRRDAYINVQRSRGELWDVLFDAPFTLESVANTRVPVHVVEGSATDVIDAAICEVLRRHMPHARHTLIDGAGHMLPLTHPEPLAAALLTGTGPGHTT